MNDKNNSVETIEQTNANNTLANNMQNEVVTISLVINTQNIGKNEPTYSFKIEGDNETNQVETWQDVCRLEKIIAQEYKVQGILAYARNIITNSLNLAGQNGLGQLTLGQETSLGEARGMKKASKFKHGNNSNQVTFKR